MPTNWCCLRVLVNALAFVCCCMTQAVFAQTYPSQPVRLVVPYPPGGTTDIVARQYAEYLTAAFKQTVVVENRPGGTTNIAAEAVVKSQPDGLTWLFSGVNQTINPSMGPVPSFDLLKVLTPVSLVARVPYVVAANSNAPFNRLDQLLSMAKSSPGKFTISSAQLDVYVELLKQRAGIDLLHIPYKGGAPATTDAISGQVHMVFALVPVLLPHIESGRLKAIAVTSTKRLPMLPNTSTLVEAGIDYDLSSWYGVLVPKATSTAIVERISQVTQHIAAMPSFVEKLRARGAVAEASSPSEFHQHIESELKFWAQIAKQMPKLVDERKLN